MGIERVADEFGRATLAHGSQYHPSVRLKRQRLTSNDKTSAEAPYEDLNTINERKPVLLDQACQALQSPPVVALGPEHCLREEAFRAFC